MVESGLLRRLGLLAVAGLGLGGCGERARGPSVLLVTLDTVRADRLGIYGDPAARTPVLDAWARAGVQARDAIADVPLTLPSHVTLFTGLPAIAHGVRTNAEHSLGEAAETLAERLASAGWSTGAVVSTRVLERDTGIAQGFASFDDEMQPDYRPRNPDRFPAGGSWLPRGDRRAEAVVAAAAPWMTTRRAAGERALLWVHLYDPHFPYDPPRPWVAALAGDAYRGEIAYVDRELRTLWRQAVRAGWIATFVADHGEGLEDHREAEHGVFLYDELVRVPLVLAGPGLPAGRVLETQVRTGDVASTLLDLAGQAPLGLGQSFVRAMSEGEAFPVGERAYAETVKPRAYSGSPLKALRTGDWKYVHAPRPELYDLRADPGERIDLLAGEAAPAAAARGDGLQRELAAWVDALVSGGHSVVAGSRRDAEDLAALESLGYVGGGGEAAGEGAGAGRGDAMATPGFDPKDLVDVALAGRDFENGFLDAADRKLDRFFATVDPQGIRPELAPLRSLAWQNRAAVAMKRGEPGRAAEAYLRSMEEEPSNEAARWGRLFALNRAGREAEAVREGERMLEETPAAWTLRLHWALSVALAGDRERARRELSAIAADAPEPQLREVAGRYAEGIGGTEESGLIALYLGRPG